MLVSPDDLESVPEHNFARLVTAVPGRGWWGVEAGWPVPSPRRWPPGVPTALTALVGRECDVAEVTRLVADNRLVTLVGSGGVGKTRLAIEEAASLASRFADGVNLVDLSEVPDPALL